MAKQKYSLEVKKLRAKIVPAFSDLEQLPETQRQHYSQFKLIPADLLVNVDWNYKKDSDTTQSKLEANLARQGQTENLHVREREDGKFDVGNGNHRNTAFQKQGVAFILCYVHECTLAEFKRRVIETNETRFAADDVDLMKIIKELGESFDPEDLKGSLPFDDHEIEAFLKFDEFDFEEFADAKGGGEGSQFQQKLVIVLPAIGWEMWSKWVAESGKEDPAEALILLLEKRLE